mgnify:FL=1
MNPIFETIQDSNRYYAFKDNISNIASFLKLDTVINFTALSKFYINILNNPKSSFGKNFWKEYAIQNQKIKKFKGKIINYKFKIVLKRVREMKRITDPSSNFWFNPRCDKCHKITWPDEIVQLQLNDSGQQFCNCKIVKCKTKRDFLKSKYQNNIEYYKFKRRVLIKQLRENNAKIDDAIERKKEFDNMPSFKSLLLILENLKENAHYKSTRSQSQRLYLEVKKLFQKEKYERPNINYKAPPENETNDDLEL